MMDDVTSYLFAEVRFGENAPGGKSFISRLISIFIDVLKLVFCRLQNTVQDIRGRNVCFIALAPFCIRLPANSPGLLIYGPASKQKCLQPERNVDGWMDG